MGNWDNKFIELSNLVASWSKDTNTKVGAVIVDEDNIVLSMGYNGFPRGCDDSIECRYEKPHKYLYTEHAERNSLYHAARHGVSLKGCTMYVTMFCCSDCARGIIQSGIKRVVAPTPDVDHEKWGEHFKAAIRMLEEAKVEISLI
jgi:dCMP deaminase